MPDKNRYDLNYRPESYWPKPGITDAIASSIKDERSRREGRKLQEAGKSIGKIHPALMGGQYLPKYAHGEVEIARITIESTTRDVVSVRARPQGNRIKYRVVDEHGNVYIIQPILTDSPLTMGELIKLIDTSIPEGEEERWRGLSNNLRNNVLLEPEELSDREISDPEQVRQLSDPEIMLDYVKITSSYYPELESYYQEEAREWVEGVKAKRLKTKGS